MAWIGVAPEPLKPNHLCPSHGEVEFLQAVSAVVNAITEASRNGMRGRAAEWGQKICQEMQLVWQSQKGGHQLHELAPLWT
ncbi:unnamed protein product [Calypogeia fissa]